VAAVPVEKQLYLEYSNEKVRLYTEFVPNTSRKTLQDIIRGRVDMKTITHLDDWRGYNGLVDLGYKKHFRVHYSKNEFARGRAYINEIAPINREGLCQNQAF
jgi:hypothetical protein